RTRRQYEAWISALRRPSCATAKADARRRTAYWTGGSACEERFRFDWRRGVRVDHRGGVPREGGHLDGRRFNPNRGCAAAARLQERAFPELLNEEVAHTTGAGEIHCALTVAAVQHDREERRVRRCPFDDLRDNNRSEVHGPGQFDLRPVDCARTEHCQMTG